MAEETKAGPGKLALAILGARPEAVSAGESNGVGPEGDVDPVSATMDTAAGELIDAVQSGDRQAVVAAFEAMFRAKMGADDSDEEV